VKKKPFKSLFCTKNNYPELLYITAKCSVIPAFVLLASPVASQSFHQSIIVLQKKLLHLVAV